MNMNRRSLLATLACGIVLGKTRILSNLVGGDSGLTAWLDQWLPRLRGVASTLINTEAGCDRLPAGIMHGIRWRQGVTLIVYKAERSEAHDRFRRMCAALRSADVTLLPAAWSDDGRAWAQFVLAEPRDVGRSLHAKSGGTLAMRGQRTRRQAAAVV
jgi:hypothetical protein